MVLRSRKEPCMIFPPEDWLRVRLLYRRKRPNYVLSRSEGQGVTDWTGASLTIKRQCAYVDAIRAAVDGFIVRSLSVDRTPLVNAAVA